MNSQPNDEDTAAENNGVKDYAIETQISESE